MVVRLSVRHHQSGRMFMFRTNKNQTWHGRQRSKVLQANRDRVFIISALVQCLSCKTSLSPSNPVYPGRKYPLTNSFSVSALFPTLLLQFVHWHTGLKGLTAFHSLGKTINPHALPSSQSNPQLPQKHCPNTWLPTDTQHVSLLFLVQCIFKLAA